MPDAKPSDELEPLREDRFPKLTALGDPALRLVAWLILNEDFRQLEQRTGIRMAGDEQDNGGKRREHPLLVLLRRFLAWLTGRRNREHFLPVLLQLDSTQGNPQISEALHARYGVPRAYRAAMKRNPKLTHVTGRLRLDADIFRGSTGSLVKAVNELRALGVSRVCLGAPGQPSRNRPSLPDIGLPADRKYNSKVLTGDGVIVGIIDDGCALAHCNFLKPRAAGASAESRILYLWDQAGTGDTSAGWAAPPDFDGLELNKAAIDAALNLPAHKSGDLIREDRVYKYLGYRIGEVATHGTHVMDTAAGSGQSMMGSEGVAPKADIIFVQLPSEAIEGGATVLWQHIVDGAAYIFERAAALNKPAVVNISYGGYDGPHDGTSELEQALDQLLLEPDRALAIAAGNGFEARCHAAKTVQQNDTKTLRWIVNPQDPTANDLEAWYDDPSRLRVRLRPPSGGISPAGWVQLGQARTPITRTSDGKTIGYIEHLPGGTGNAANRIVVSLNATDAAADSGTSARAPSGVWRVDLKHASGPRARVHAWIWRDDAGRSRNARRRQSRFHPDDAYPASTIAGWATGHLTVSVGAYNTATQEICGYSACGPTRPTGGTHGREKPEVYAPAEEDVRRRGVLSASALSANPARMNGTSASAPHVAGLIALMFEYARKHAAGAPVSLTADQIRREVKAGATVAPINLKFDRHQKVDARVETKQEDVPVELLASGKADFTETMKKLPQ